MEIRQPLSPQRHLFDIPSDICYLNCAFVGPLSTEVRAAGERAVARKSQPWRLTAADFFTECEEARALFAALIDASADDIGLVPSTGFGISTAARNLPVRADETIIVMDQEFPANYYAWERLARVRGAKLEPVLRPPGGDWTESLVHAIRPGVRIVAVSPCHWIDGAVANLAALRERCDAVDAALVVDGTQWVGAAPFSVREVRPDFLVTATYKWLLGPYSYGFLYVHPKFQQGEPLEENWFSRRGSDNFAALTSYPAEYQHGARRFDVGERSNFILLPMVLAALKSIHEWQPERIAHFLGEVTTRIANIAARLDFETVPAGSRSPHILGLRLPEALRSRTAPALASRNVFASVRGHHLRISPHIYTTNEDVELLEAALRELKP